ncbi:MAG TPA: hypothetical protein VJ901_14120 [Thermoanaerobaculia bacterium]|nr:hypothetical protein [Thermoanaerobaculia bacterium]
MKIFLRIASLVALLQFAAHTTLLLQYVPRHGPDEVRVVEVMKSYRFDFHGSQPHSYWDMYLGYGLFAAFNCLIEALLFWFLSSRPDKALIAILLIANLCYAAMVYRWFFFIPLYADLVIAVCLTAALFSASRNRHVTGTLIQSTNSL